MNDSIEYKTFCPKCGAEMKSSQRCCMKCGHLNYDHPDNQSIKQYADKDVITPKSSGFGLGAIMDNPDHSSVVYASKAGNRKLCIAVNLFLSFLSMILFFFSFSLINASSYFETLTHPSFCIGLLLITFFSLFSISMQFIYMKANYPWWSYFIPFYNGYVFFAITMKNGWYFLITFIPILGFFFALYACYQLGKRFGKNPLVTCLFSIFSIIVIAFQPTVYYENICYVNSSFEGRDTVSENIYRSNKLVLVFFALIFLLSILFLCYPYFDFIIKRLPF